MSWRQFRNGSLLCFSDSAIIDERSAPDTVVITAKLVTVLLEDGELMLDGRNLLSSVRRLHSKQIGAWLAETGIFLLQPFGWLTGRERSDSFVRDDVVPGFAECAVLLKTVWPKLARGHSRNAPSQRRSEKRLRTNSPLS